MPHDVPDCLAISAQFARNAARLLLLTEQSLPCRISRPCIMRRGDLAVLLTYLNKAQV